MFELTHGFSEAVAYFAYDAVWALVLALNELSDLSFSTFDPFDISSPENRLVGERLRDSLGNVAFLGLSVSSVDRVHIVSLFHVRQSGADPGGGGGGCPGGPDPPPPLFFLRRFCLFAIQIAPE